MRFEILGPLRVRANAGEVTISSARERTLLAVLLLHANRTVPIDQLVEAIWAEQPPAGARNQLQGCVSRLRKRLATAGLVIITEPAGYRATVPSDDLDLLEFRRLVGKARTTSGSHADAVSSYRAALDLWRGPALGGVDTGRMNVAVALDEEHVQVQEECIEAELAAGGGGRLVPELTELVGQHPHRERLHCALMLALYRADRQADALAAYRHARTMLHDELGIEPGTELQRLHQAILNRDPDLDSPTPTPTRPDASKQPPTPRELPADVAGFTGRTDALKTLDELLVSEQPDGPPAPVVISAIAGTAGVGKTALAVHWAHQVADRFPDGQLYLNLRGYATTAPVRPIEALSALLRSLGTEQIPTDEAQAAALYRTQLAGRRALIVLDNARSVDQVRPLLPGAPGCLVLVTSRDRLTGLVARDGATRLTIDVLAPDEAQALLSSLLGADRAEAEPAAIHELARACAYLPLALRIAAAHLVDRPDRPISTYVLGLTRGDRLALLQVDGDDAHAVSATLKISYDTLPAETQRTFRLLGLAPGPDFTTSAVGALTGIHPKEAENHLRQLVRTHLVNEQIPGRYTFHDLLRLYARRHAEAGEASDQRHAAARRILAYYVRTTESAAQVLYPEMPRLPLPKALKEAIPATRGFIGRESALSWLDEERANLVAGIRYAVDHGPRPVAWLLADYLRGYFVRWRNAIDWRSLAEAALTAAEEDDDPQAQAATHLGLGSICFATSSYHEAVDHYTRAARLAEQARWVDGRAAALGNLGTAYRSLGQLPQAAKHQARSLALHQQENRLGAEATNRGNLGLIYYELGRLQEAAEQLTKALALFRRVGAARGEAISLLDLGYIYHSLGRLDQARRSATDAHSLYREVGDPDGEIESLLLLATVLSDMGETVDALRHAQAGMAMAVELDDPVIRALAFNSLGYVRLSYGSPADAVDHYQCAVKLIRNHNYRPAEAASLVYLAIAQLRVGNLDAANHAASEGLDLAREAGYQVIEGQALTCLAEVRLGQRDLWNASEYASGALYHHRKSGHRPGEARTLIVLGHIADAAGQPQTAQEQRRRASALFAEIGTTGPKGLKVEVVEATDE